MSIYILKQSYLKIYVHHSYIEDDMLWFFSVLSEEFIPIIDYNFWKTVKTKTKSDYGICDS